MLFSKKDLLCKEMKKLRRRMRNELGFSSTTTSSLVMIFDYVDVGYFYEVTVINLFGKLTIITSYTESTLTIEYINRNVLTAKQAIDVIKEIIKRPKKKGGTVGEFL